MIALVLAALFETNLHLTLRLHELGRLSLLQRPVSLMLLTLLAVTMVWPAINRVVQRRRRETR